MLQARHHRHKNTKSHAPSPHTGYHKDSDYYHKEGEKEYYHKEGDKEYYKGPGSPSYAPHSPPHPVTYTPPEQPPKVGAFLVAWLECSEAGRRFCWSAWWSGVVGCLYQQTHMVK